MKQFLKIADLFFVLFYIVIGVFFLVYKGDILNMASVYRNIFGIILVLYGVFRANLFYNKYFVNNEDK